MKKLILASAIASAFAGQVAFAADAAPAATPEHQIAYTVTVTSDYRFRGISQTQKEAALQFAADYSHTPTGLYFGAFASNVKWVKASAITAGSDETAPVEIDLYGGMRGDIGSSGLTFDLGAIQYFFPGENLKTTSLARAANTSEVYGQIGFGPAYAKYSYSLTDTFATGARGSFYIDTGINYPLSEKLTLNAHIGHQTYKNTGAYNYNYEDYKFGVTNDFGYFVGSIAYIGTNAIHGNYLWNNTSVSKDTVVFSAAKTF
jgi:uncharacterized protein (TIGR02001 family)